MRAAVRATPMLHPPTVTRLAGLDGGRGPVPRKLRPPTIGRVSHLPGVTPDAQTAAAVAAPSPAAVAEAEPAELLLLEGEEGDDGKEGDFGLGIDYL